MAIVRKIKSEVVSIDNPLEGVYVVVFRALEKKFKFKPGQFLHLTLDEVDPSQPWPPSRCFSVQSSPEESDIKITFSVVGEYTKRMAEELATGKEVYLKLPYGDLFSQGHSKDNCIFIAGGTGVTPYLSLFTSSEFADYNNPHLYLGIRESKFNIYGKELQQASASNSSLNIDIVDQSVDGILNIEKIFATNGTDATYFISGPPAMINNFKSYLLDQGLVEEKVLTDDWE